MQRRCGTTEVVPFRLRPEAGKSCAFACGRRPGSRALSPGAGGREVVRFREGPPHVRASQRRWGHRRYSKTTAEAQRAQRLKPGKGVIATRRCGTTEVVPFPPGQRPGSRALSPAAGGREVVPFRLRPEAEKSYAFAKGPRMYAPASDGEDAVLRLSLRTVSESRTAATAKPPQRRRGRSG
jgi:hypothetical protein